MCVSHHAQEKRGCQQAGPRAAILFTVLAGAKRHRIEPWTYLRELLLRLHDDDSRLDEMLPNQWAMQYPEAMLNYRLEESRRKAAAQSTRRRHARAESRPR
jgi:transposase